MTDLQSNFAQAIQLVLFDFDLSDRAVPQTVQSQASLMALVSPEQIGSEPQD